MGAVDVVAADVEAVVSVAVNVQDVVAVVVAEDKELVVYFTMSFVSAALGFCLRCSHVPSCPDSELFAWACRDHLAD